MEEGVDPRLVVRLRRVAAVAAACALGAAALAAVGWRLGSTRLETALAIAALATAVLLDGAGRTRLAALAAATAVASIGAMAAARTSVVTTAALACGAAATLLLGRSLRGRHPAPWLALAMLLIGVHALAGYAYGWSALDDLAPRGPRSLLGGFAITALGVAILFARPTTGAVAILVSDTLGGQLARRVLPLVAALMLIAGWVRLLGEAAGLYDMVGGVALYAGVNLAVIVVVVWVSAVRLGRVDRERRELDAQLGAADRLATVGVLAAGVGHEINNALAAQLLSLELIARGNRDPELEPLIADARVCGERIREIVGDLRMLSRPHAIAPAPIALEPVLETTLRIANHQLRERARVERAYRPAPSVLANEARVGQVVLNLLLNAADAIPDGDRDGNVVRVALDTDDDGWAVIEVSDTGRGIEPAIARRLFEPFFTTRSTGTGLGLSISHRIVTALGGAITVETRPGAGATFRVRLPPAPTPP